MSTDETRGGTGQAPPAVPTRNRPRLPALAVSALALSALVCRVAVGGLFVATGATKFAAPVTFIRAVEAYRLLPAWAVTPAAALVAAAEPLLGAALLAGVRLDLACPALAGLTLLFMGAIGSAMVRNLGIDCGCAFLAGQAGWEALARDTALLAALLLVWWQRTNCGWGALKPGRRAPPAQGGA